jgi:hypothetical protein
MSGLAHGSASYPNDCFLVAAVCDGTGVGSVRCLDGVVGGCMVSTGWIASGFGASATFNDGKDGMGRSKFCC